MSLACVYGVPDVEWTPLGGVWLIHKHAHTGELLGPSVVGWMPTKAVFAELTPEGWSELGEAEAKRRTDEAERLP